MRRLRDQASRVQQVSSLGCSASNATPSSNPPTSKHAGRSECSVRVKRCQWKAWPSRDCGPTSWTNHVAEFAVHPGSAAVWGRIDQSAEFHLSASVARD